MIGTIIIAVVGYGLALSFAYSSAFHCWKSCVGGKIARGEIHPAIEAVLNAICACVVAAATRGMTGGQF